MKASTVTLDFQPGAFVYVQREHAGLVAAQKRAYALAQALCKAGEEEVDVEIRNVATNERATILVVHADPESLS
jgi:ferredoxin-NADP reductase